MSRDPTRRLKAAAFYYDAQVEYAERIAVENAVSARDNGAAIITYARVGRRLHQRGVHRRARGR